MRPIKDYVELALMTCYVVLFWAAVYAAGCAIIQRVYGG